MSQHQLLTVNCWWNFCRLRFLFPFTPGFYPIKLITLYKQIKRRYVIFHSGMGCETCGMGWESQTELWN